MRSGKCDVMRLPIRMISTCGIARSRWKMYSSRRSLSIIGSPPDMITSRTSGCAAMYSNADSYWLSGIFSGSPTFRRRVQNRQYDAHTGLRSEEHTSELQSLAYLVCRLLLEKKKNKMVELST